MPEASFAETDSVITSRLSTSSASTSASPASGVSTLSTLVRGALIARSSAAPAKTTETVSVSMMSPIRGWTLTRTTAVPGVPGCSSEKRMLPVLPAFSAETGIWQLIPPLPPMQPPPSRVCSRPRLVVTSTEAMLFAPAPPPPAFSTCSRSVVRSPRFASTLVNGLSSSVVVGSPVSCASASSALATSVTVPTVTSSVSVSVRSVSPFSIVKLPEIVNFPSGVPSGITISVFGSASTQVQRVVSSNTRAEQPADGDSSIALF